jgi:crossover junction endodeoxyribonuclease RuvC
MAACGVLRAPRREALAERLHCLHSGLLSLLDRWQPGEAAVEDLFYARNARAALVLGQARGVALLALCQRGLRPVSYSPLSVKQAVTGSGAADKEQVRRWVCRWLETTARNIEIDASDALAVALCHARSRRWRSLESAAPLPRPRRRPAATAGRSASARAPAGARQPARGRMAQRARALPR